jgi:outer membrane protein TolC
VIKDFTQQKACFLRYQLTCRIVVCLSWLLLGVAVKAQGQALPYAASRNSPSGTTSSPLNIPSAGTQNPFTGSVPMGKATPEVLPLTFEEAINRGLQQNLGLLLASDSAISARGERWKELSNLLPNVNGTLGENVQTTSIAQFGFKIPGIPRVIGPYNYSDIRGSVNQSVLNFNFIQKERAAAQNLKSAQFSYKDARELVVLAVGNSYLQALAGTARVETADAQVRTAQALYDKAVDQQRAGVSPAIDVLRAQVELQTRQQQLIVARSDFAKQKLALARIIGLPPGQEFLLADTAPYSPLTTEGLEQNLRRAYASRSDYQAALSQVRAAELSRRAATAEYFPSLEVEADYGDIGVSPFRSNGTYHIGGTVNIPIFQGGRVHGDTLQAEASLRQARQEMENLRGQIDFDVRTAMLDLNAAADQVKVAQSSVDLAQQTLTQAQDRFSAGVTDNLEVVQAQEAVASANENYIASLYAHNLAKVEFAKAIGYAEQGVKNYLRGK